MERDRPAAPAAFHQRINPSILFQLPNPMILQLIFLFSAVLNVFGFTLAPIRRDATLKSNGHADLALILLQGAMIAPNRYQGLAKALQNQYKKPLWVVVPETIFETPLTFLGTGKAIERAQRELIAHGFNRNGSLFLAGHSLGGPAVQDYIHAHPDFARGVILLGCALARKYNESNPLKPPVISINGELDTQVRIKQTDSIV